MNEDSQSVDSDAVTLKEVSDPSEDDKTQDRAIQSLQEWILEDNQTNG
jgi:hypothetical protein